MANVNILNLPVAIALDGTEYVPCVQAGTTKRVTTALIAGEASGFVPDTASVNAGLGMSGGGLVIDSPSLNFDPHSLSPKTAMVIADGFAINDVAGSNTPKLVTFPNAMKAISGMTALAIPSLLNDYLCIYHAADGLTYKIAPSALSLAAGNVPAGGTTGQFLSKVSNTDYDTAWTPSSILLNAYSVAANVTGSTALGTSLTGSAYQILRIGSTGASLAFGAIDLSQSAAVDSSILGLLNGGTAAALTASNGGIFYSTATAGAILAATATAGQILRSGSNAAPSWSTSTYPATSAAGTVQASLTANTVTATAAPVLGASGTTGTLSFAGSSSGVVTIQPQAAAGTFNFNLPTTAGTSGLSLLSGGGVAAPMTWGHDAAAGITVGTTTITSGTNSRILYDNSGVLGEYTLTGTGTVAVMQNTPTLTTPVLGVATGTSLALGGATLGSNALAVTGGVAGSAQIWSGAVSSALTTLTGGSDGFRNSSANVTQFAGENTTSSSATQGGFFGGYSNDGAALASGDRLGGIRTGGSSSASALRNSAVIAAFAAENWVDASAYGSRWEFQTTSNTTTSITTKMILSNAGLLAFGATLANTVPAVKPSSTTLAVRLGDDSADAPLSASTVTCSTSLVSPLVIGGAAAGSSLTLESTSGSGSSDFINFKTASQSDRGRVLTGGELIWGYTARVAVGQAGTTFPLIQNHGTGVTAIIETYRWSNDASGASLGMAKSKGTSIGSRGAVTTDDSLGSLIWHGDDGTNFISSAAIQALCDGTVASNQVPSRLSFQTTTSGGTITEAVVINKAQQLNAKATTDTTSPTTGAVITAGGVGIAKALSVGTNVTLGVQQTTQGTLVLSNTAAGAFTTTIQSSNSSNQGWTLTLPINDGNNGEVLSTNGSGVTSWVSVGGTGTVTSITPGNGATSDITAAAPGSAITGAGTLSTTHPVNAQTGTTYTVLDGDRAKLVTHTNGSAIAVTLPQANATTSFVSGWHYFTQNRGAGLVTITPTTSTIDGAATLTIPTGQGCLITSDGTNYFTMRGSPSGLTVAQGGTGLATLTTSAIYKGAGTSALAVSSITDDGTTFAIATNKFTVTEASGNAAFAGTLTITTSNAFTCGSIELGAASDTTVSRLSAGIIQVESVPLYSQIPQNSQSTAYTTVLADAQKHLLHPTADNNARTFTIDSNANVAYPIGTCITFVNQINTVTIAITSDTLTLAGTGTTGSRTLAAAGIATALKIATTSWIISGTGLT